MARLILSGFQTYPNSDVTYYNLLIVNMHNRNEPNYILSNDENIISNIFVTSVVFDDYLWYVIQDIPT
jgi:hypothetical protein